MQRELGFANVGFKDGKYEGTLFFMTEGSPSGEHPLAMTLKFENRIVKGEVECAALNAGSFDIEGTYSEQPPFDFEGTSKAHSITFSGARQKDAELQGRWKHTTDASKTGLFEVARIPDGISRPQQAVQALVDMGMDPAAAAAAINTHGLSVEEAVEWIGNGCPPMTAEGELLAVEPSQADVATIMEMGFPEDVAKGALAAANNDVQRALNALLG